MKRMAVAGLLGALVLLLAFVAAAKPSFKDRSRALQLSNKAALLARQGKHEQAVETLRESDGLDPKPSVKFRLAKSLIELHQLIEAEKVLQAAAQDTAPTWHEKQAARNSKKLAEELKARIPTLTVAVVQPKPSEAAASLTLDGESLDPAVGPVPLDPGTHEVVAKADGYQDESFEVTLEERANQTLKISLTKVPGPVEPEEEEAEGGGMGMWPAIVAWSVGGVALAVGAAFGIVAMDQTNTLLEDYDCNDNRCPPEAQDDLNTSIKNGNISTGAFIVAGAGLALGTVLWLVADSGDDDEPGDDEAVDEQEDARSVHVRPLLGPGYAGLVGTF